MFCALCSSRLLLPTKKTAKLMMCGARWHGPVETGLKHRNCYWDPPSILSLADSQEMHGEEVKPKLKQRRWPNVFVPCRSSSKNPSIPIMQLDGIFHWNLHVLLMTSLFPRKRNSDIFFLEVLVNVSLLSICLFWRHHGVMHAEEVTMVF